MKIQIEIDMVGAAFENGAMAEVRRILHEYFAESPLFQDWPLRDINGNRVGDVNYK